jgi:hypothetical protein
MVRVMNDLHVFVRHSYYLRYFFHSSRTNNFSASILEKASPVEWLRLLRVQGYREEPSISRL